MTATDLINSSLRLIGVTASGEQPTADEANDAFVILNQMIDSWTTERLMIFTITIIDTPLVPGTQTYTLGTGGTLNFARPSRIERMSIVNLNNPAQPLELPLEMLSDQEWQSVPVKIINSALPTKVYDDGAFPFRNLSFWPIPTVLVNTRIYGWSALTQFPDLFTDETFPPGYLKALRYNLAVDLAPEYGVPLRPEVAAQAISSKAVIKSINAPMPVSYVDPAIRGEKASVYNWLTDQPAGRH